MEFSGVCVDGVGGAVCRGQGVSVHHNLSCLICMLATGRGWGCSCGTSESATSSSNKRLFGTLGFGPACGSGTGGQQGHQDNKKGDKEDPTDGWHTEDFAQ